MNCEMFNLNMYQGPFTERGDKVSLKRKSNSTTLIKTHSHTYERIINGLVK